MHALHGGVFAWPGKSWEQSTRQFAFLGSREKGHKRDWRARTVEWVRRRTLLLLCLRLSGLAQGCEMMRWSKCLLERRGVVSLACFLACQCLFVDPLACLLACLPACLLPAILHCLLFPMDPS